MIYTYHINLDERGSFEADVRNPFDKTVFEISGGAIFEDGFMKDKKDLSGLQKYLQQLKIIQPADTLIASDSLMRGAHSTRMHTIRKGQKMATGGDFSLEYLNNPEYIRLDEQYKKLLEENTHLDKQSNTLRRNLNRMEDLQNRKKRIALGEKFVPMPPTTGVRNIHSTSEGRIKNKHFISTPMLFNKGGSLKDNIESMLEDYEPQFLYSEKSDMDFDVDRQAHKKNYFIYLKVSGDIIDKINNNTEYREAQIEHFKKFGYSRGKNFNTLMYDVTTTSENNPEVMLEVSDMFSDEPRKSPARNLFD